MSAVERAHLGGERLLVLWTWLLEGYVPVVHMVADLDELEAMASDEAGEAPSGHASRGRLQPAGAAA